VKALIIRTKLILRYISDGNLKPIVRGLFVRLYSKVNSIGLEISPKDAKFLEANIEIKIRPFQNTDINALNEGLRHARLVDENIPDCYVATTINDITVYRQWLFKYDQNNQIATYFGPIFPKLKKDEVLIEGVFTHTKYRGLRIMPDATVKILRQKQYKHVNRVIVFVDENNIPSLKSFNRIGFKPFIIRQERWLFFKRTVSFISMTSEVQKKFESLIPIQRT